MRFKVLWLLKMAAALVCALLFWEGMLRLAIIRPVAYRADPKLGWMPQPHARGLHSGEGFSTLRFNALGFRGAEIVAPQRGQTRLLALGDSFTEGRQIDEPSTFPRRLETMLHSCGDVRVLNGGRDGVSPAYAVYLADEYRRIFAPDWVILLVRDGNWQQVFSRDYEVSYRREGDGFQMQTQWQGERRSRLRDLSIRLGINDSAFYNYAKTRFMLLNSAAPVAAEAAPPNPQEVEWHLAQEKRAVRWTMQRLHRQFPRLVVAHIPFATSEGGGLVPTPPLEQELKATCEKENIAFISLRAPIEADFARTQQPPFGFANTLPWTGHPNGHGHEIIARELAQFFRSRLCPPSAARNFR